MCLQGPSPVTIAKGRSITSEYHQWLSPISGDYQGDYQGDYHQWLSGW